MQLFALDTNNDLIHAAKAVRQRDYLCPECRDTLRVRSGKVRLSHFFHLQEGVCRQSQKSEEHCQVQNYIEKILPEGEAFQEKGFPEINRIADLFWEKEKIVFEVQCSPIDHDEIKGRNEDYGKLGFDVVWILHDMRYNKKKLTDAEAFLQGKVYFYTNIDAKAQGMIYDQFQIIDEGCSLFRLEKLEVNLAAPTKTGFDGDVYSSSLNYKLRGLIALFRHGLLLLFNKVKKAGSDVWEYLLEQST